MLLLLLYSNKIVTIANKTPINLLSSINSAIKPNENQLTLLRCNKLNITIMDDVCELSPVNCIAPPLTFYSLLLHFVP